MILFNAQGTVDGWAWAGLQKAPMTIRVRPCMSVYGANMMLA